MTQTNHQIVRDFFAAISRGETPDALFTPDMTGWTASSGTSEKARFLGGIRLLTTIFSGPYHYSIKSLTAEDDRVVAEVHGSGMLVSGEAYANDYAFIFRIRDGRIASVAEHSDVALVREKLHPLLAAAMAKAGV
ncbi:nuclear transport factor 2 family protein [Sphingomonas sp. LaA6.9]|uniref:nuclear transport factor 2 family protein n=1 Tax=Sphingomonas sp. LaA6.9 TaxID=2919914 RepID=UPI001F4F2E39|nr:nuclear transport factor 2 family protein [Sphingomonas sp. LaA6.9]MCJ8158553.1 nuclear transport factor 2 family protein [Sphingomonas sp. LaA6.9]